MFQNVRQNSPFYILSKGEDMSLVVATVESVSNPMPRFNTSYPAPTFGNDMVVDITVKVGEERREYKQLPANLSIANFGNSGLVVSDDRAAMCSEVESFMANSKKYLEAVPYHESVMAECPKMLLELNPQLAKEQKTEDRINGLEQQVSGISDNLSKMMGMLSDALEQKKSKKTE